MVRKTYLGIEKILKCFYLKPLSLAAFFYGGEGENGTLHTIDYKTTFQLYSNALYYNKLQI